MLEMIRIKRKPNIYQIKSIRVGSLEAAESRENGWFTRRIIEQKFIFT